MARKKRSKKKAETTKQPAAEAPASPAADAPARIERVPCHFTSVNLPDNTKATVGIKFSKVHLPIEVAETVLCGAQLNATLTLETKDQPVLPGMVPHTLDVVCEVKRYGSSPKEIGATLNMNRDGIDPAELARFASQDGMISAKRTGTAGKSDENSDDIPCAAETDELDFDGDDDGEDGEDGEEDIRPTEAKQREAERKRQAPAGAPS